MTEMMSSAVQIERAGGPEVMELVVRADPEPGPDELLVEVAAAGVNFIDTYHRSRSRRDWTVARADGKAARG